MIFTVLTATGVSYVQQLFTNLLKLHWAIPETRCTLPKEDFMGSCKILPIFSQKLNHFFSRKGKQGG